MYRITFPGTQNTEHADLHDALCAAEDAYRALGDDQRIASLTWRLEWHHGRRRRVRLIADGLPVTLGTPEGVHVDETVLPTTVTFNPTYGIRFDDGGICALYNPGGFWAVKVRQRGREWVGFAVPRKGTEGEPFDIVGGPDRDEVWYMAQKWAGQSSIITVAGQRFIFAGFGDTTEETPLSEPAGAEA